MPPKPGRASIKGIFPSNSGLSVSQIVLSAGMCIPVIKIVARFCSYFSSFVMSISVERLIFSRCRPSIAFTARKSTVGRAVRAAIRAVSPFNYVCAGFDWNSRWECQTLSVIHSAGKRSGSGVKTTTTVPRGGQNGRRDGGRDKALSLEGRRRAEEDGW